jgi:hypothetical protein
MSAAKKPIGFEKPEKTSKFVSIKDRKQQKKENRQQAVATSRLLITDIPADLQHIYGRTLKSLIPAVRPVIPAPSALSTSSSTTAKLGEKRGRDEATPQVKNASIEKCIAVNQEVDGATLVVTVRNKHDAQQYFNRLQNCKVFGRKLKVEYHPLSSTECSAEPIVMVVQTSERCPVSIVRQHLSNIDGFLSVELIGSGATKKIEGVAVDGDTEAATSISLTPTSKRFIATFADEGAALHARALLSGRVIGTLGNIRALAARDGDVVTQDPRETKHNQKTVHMCLTRR